jgi:hypothetical protein
MAKDLREVLKYPIIFEPESYPYPVLVGSDGFPLSDEAMRLVANIMNDLLMPEEESLKRFGLKKEETE